MVSDFAEVLKKELPSLTRFENSKIEIKEISDIIKKEVKIEEVSIIVPSLRLDNPDFKSDAPLDADFIPPLTDLSPSSCLDATVFNPELIWFKLDAALFNWLDCSFKLPPNCFICAASSVSPSAAAFWAKAVIWASSSLESEDDNLEETWETESANESTLLVELIKLSTPSPNWFNPLFKLLAPLYAEDIPLSILSYALSKLFALLT